MNYFGNCTHTIPGKVGPSDDRRHLLHRIMTQRCRSPTITPLRIAVSGNSLVQYIQLTILDNAWKHRFSSECMSVLHDQAFGAKTPSYATVLQLDRKLRAFPVPPILQVAGFGSTDPSVQGNYPETVMLTLQRHIVLAIRETSASFLSPSMWFT